MIKRRWPRCWFMERELAPRSTNGYGILPVCSSEACQDITRAHARFSETGDTSGTIPNQLSQVLPSVWFREYHARCALLAVPVSRLLPNQPGPMSRHTLRHSSPAMLVSAGTESTTAVSRNMIMTAPP